VKGANGELRNFGFADFGDAETALRAFKVLNGKQVVDSNFLLKVDDSTKQYLDERETEMGLEDGDLFEGGQMEKVEEIVEKINSAYKTNFNLPEDELEVKDEDDEIMVAVKEELKALKEKHKEENKEKVEMDEKMRVGEERRRQILEHYAEKERRREVEDEEEFKRCERDWLKKERDKNRRLNIKEKRERERRRSRKREIERDETDSSSVRREMRAAYRERKKEWERDKEEEEGERLEKIRKEKEKKRREEEELAKHAIDINSKSTVRVKLAAPKRPQVAPTFSQMEVEDGGEEHKMRRTKLTNDLISMRKLVDTLPSTLEEIWKYEVNWKVVDESNIIETKVRQYLKKKMMELFGEPEETLIGFICKKMSEHGPAKEIYNMLGKVLDKEELDEFFQHLWRKLIFETKQAENRKI